MQASLLQLDEPRRLQQGVQEAHIRRGPRRTRPMSRRDWPRAPRSAHVAAARPDQWGASGAVTWPSASAYRGRESNKSGWGVINAAADRMHSRFTGGATRSLLRVRAKTFTSFFQVRSHYFSKLTET
ncbi:unnamed protein product [Leptosia nina]|uniref:Uncharacterized protein n=1 Tax=Leptosia nina TaxID=320188 RepID=A0AAV1IZ42_9NEOP